MAQKAYKIFTLEDPIEIEGRDAITTVKCNRPKWKHIKRMMAEMSPEVEGDDHRTSEERRADQQQDVEAIDQLLRDLCNLHEDEMDELGLDDTLAIFEWIESFQKKFQKAGETS